MVGYVEIGEEVDFGSFGVCFGDELFYRKKERGGDGFMGGYMVKGLSVRY